MLKLLQAGPTVKVTVEQDTLFVCPSLDSSSPSEDPEIRGTVLLSLPTKRAVKTIRVVLEGIGEVNGVFSGGIHSPHETTTTLEKHLELDLAGETLEAGDHAFNFSFIVPSSTAVYQLCTYGRVNHYVKAKVNFASGLGGSASSKGVALRISATESQLHDIPSALEIEIEHFGEDLGPIAIGISSPHLTVSSLVNFRLTFVSPPVHCTINSIHAFVHQTFDVHYKNGTITNPPPKKAKLIHLNESSLPPSIVIPSKDIYRTPDPFPLNTLEPGKEWKYSRIARVPDDDYVTPSTLEATQGNIRVINKLLLEVKYKPEGKEHERLMTISKEVHIASCCCTLDERFLPAYVRKAPETVLAPKTARCACQLSLKEMVDRDGLALEQAGSIQTSAFQERLLGVDRSDKSPQVSTSV